MVDTVKTRAQLIERAGAAIGVKEPGEALSTEDYNTFDNLVDPLIAQLSADGIYYVQDDNEIPVEIFIPLANLLGNMAGPDFGSPINEEAKQRDEKTLQRIASTRPTYSVMKGQYF
jgi:hypothetical protein